MRSGEEHALAKLAGRGAWGNKGRVSCAVGTDQAGGEPKYLAARLANAEHALELIGSDASQNHSGIVLIEGAAIGYGIADIPARKQEVPSRLQAMETIGRGPMVTRTEGELVNAVGLEYVAEIPRGRILVRALVTQRGERHKVHGTVSIVVGERFGEGVVSCQLEALREAAPHFNLQGIVGGL